MDETPAQPGPTPAGPPPGTPYEQRTGADSFFDSIRRFGVVRSDERWVGGVAGGLAQRMGIDPLVVRGLFGIGALLGGIGLVLYGVGWLLLPEQRDGRIHLQQLFRGDFDAAVIGGFAAILIGLGASDAWGLPWWGNGRGWWGGAVGVLVIVAIVLVVVNLGRDSGRGPTTSLPRPAPGTPYAAPYAAPAAAAPAATATTSTSATRPSEGTTMPAVPPTAASTGAGPTTPPAQPYGQPYTPQYGQPYGQPQYAGPAGPTGPRPGPVTSLPPTPEHTGPGARPVGIVVALSLLVLAGLLYAERIGQFDHPVLLTTAGVMVVLAGIGIAIAGAFGRSSGGLGALAVITLIVSVPMGAASDIRWNSSSRFVGDATYHPTTVAEAEAGYSVVAGTVILDLTDVPLGGETVTVPVSVGAGELTVIVPEGAAYTAEVRLTAGEITWLDEPSISGIGDAGRRTFTSEAVADGAEPDLELELSVMAGELTVEEGR